MSDKVDFTAMEHANRAEYDLVFEHEDANIMQQGDRVLQWLAMMEGDSPYQISRLDHCLQTATRAQRDGADDETVVCALLHDIGDVLAPANHSQVAAALLRPYVSEKNYWIVLHHGLFQGYYWLHHYGKDRDIRDRYRDHSTIKPVWIFAPTGISAPSTPIIPLNLWHISNPWCENCSREPPQIHCSE